MKFESIPEFCLQKNIMHPPVNTNVSDPDPRASILEMNCHKVTVKFKAGRARRYLF